MTAPLPKPMAVALVPKQAAPVTMHARPCFVCRAEGLCEHREPQVIAAEAEVLAGPVRDDSRNGTGNPRLRLG